MTVENHVVDYGKHPLFRVWRGDGDQDESNDDWKTNARQLTNTGPQLDKSIDLGRLLDDVLLS
jgi:hypothetical protein